MDSSAFHPDWNVTRAVDLQLEPLHPLAPMSEPHSERSVRGVLFADYVRMIRRRKDVDWSKHLLPEDGELLHGHVEPDAWYPMSSFERMGNAILAAIAGGDEQAVRLWGRLSVAPLAEQYPALVAAHDPMETLMRFHVLRSTFFDFAAVRVAMATPEQAELEIHYYMGPVAEEAASYQTMGFFEGLLALAGAVEVRARFRERSWEGDARTLLALDYHLPD